MAAKVRLRHPSTGMMKSGFLGFSWTTFFFGGIPALLRGDLLGCIVIVLLSLALGAFIPFVGWFIGCAIAAAVYNGQYTKRLIEKGYVIDDKDAVASKTADRLGVTVVETKKCPQCAETIKAEATVCRYCQYSFTPVAESA